MINYLKRNFNIKKIRNNINEVYINSSELSLLIEMDYMEEDEYITLAFGKDEKINRALFDEFYLEIKGEFSVMRNGTDHILAGLEHTFVDIISSFKGHYSVMKS